MQIVLVHGGWVGGWVWDGVADELRRMGHEVIAPTLRGLEDGDVAAQTRIGPGGAGGKNAKAVVALQFVPDSGDEYPHLHRRQRGRERHPEADHRRHRGRLPD